MIWRLDNYVLSNKEYENEFMNERDKQLSKDSALALADSIASTIPPLALAWSLSKTYYGAALKVRQQKALEWVEMVRDNPSFFTEEILKDEKFQDGFVYALEKYLQERNEEKRKYYRNIFLGFTKSNNKPRFELERYYHVLSLLDEFSIETLQYVDIHTPGSYQLFDDARKIQDIHALINAGILYLDTTARYNGSGKIDSPFVYTSDFGRNFIMFLKNEN